MNLGTKIYTLFFGKYVGHWLEPDDSPFASKPKSLCFNSSFKLKLILILTLLFISCYILSWLVFSPFVPLAITDPSLERLTESPKVWYGASPSISPIPAPPSCCQDIPPERRYTLTCPLSIAPPLFKYEPMAILKDIRSAKFVENKRVKLIPIAKPTYTIFLAAVLP